MSTPVPTASTATPLLRRGARRRAASLVMAAAVASFASISGPSAVAGTVAGTADLAVALTDRPDPASVGQHVFYTVTTRNRGPASATGVRLSVSLPDGASFASASSTKGTCESPVDSMITCRLGEVLPGTKAGVTIDVVPSGPGVMRSEASVRASQADPNLGNNQRSTETTVTEPIADISLAMSVEPDPAAVGQLLSYSLDVRNAGPDAATRVRLANDLPSGVVFARAVPSAGKCSSSTRGGRVSCSLGSLAPGANLNVRIGVYPTENGTIRYGASVTADQPDATPASASTVTTVTGTACTITGTDGDDELAGTRGSDVICGLGGSDRIFADSGNDRVDGGPGNDILQGSSGADQLFGRGGDDHLGGGADFDLARFDASDSPVDADIGAGRASGEGSDTLSFVEGIVGSPHADVLHGNNRGNEIYGRGGDDMIAAGNGFDYARYDFAPAGVTVDLPSGVSSGGEGTDSLSGVEGIIGSAFVDTLIGDEKANQLGGRGGDDVVRGGAALDYALYSFAPAPVTVNLLSATATGGDGNDSLVGIEGIIGSAFADVLAGDEGRNVISAGSGADAIRGGDSADTLFGQVGEDVVEGLRGDDYLDGGHGKDRLDGGANRDRCIAGKPDRAISCESIGSPRDLSSSEAGPSRASATAAGLSAPSASGPPPQSR
jgi:uncharacterized repeat protein (TIGR01451 family)